MSKILCQILIFFITLYQYSFSAILGQNCRFYPTCSHYAKQALQNHGLFAGLILTMARLLQCNPFVNPQTAYVPNLPQKFLSQKLFSKGVLKNLFQFKQNCLNCKQLNYSANHNGTGQDSPDREGK